MLGEQRKENIRLGNVIYGPGKPFGDNGCHIVLHADFKDKLLKVEIVEEKELDEKLEERAGGKQASLL